MRGVARSWNGILLAFGVVTVFGLAGCSVMGTTQPPGFGASEATAFSQQVARAFSLGVQGAHASFVSGHVLPATLINVNVGSTTNCTAGGSIHVLGSLTGSLDNNGTGVLQLQVTETILDWQCIGSYVINGDPDISAAGTFSFLNGQQSSMAQIDFGGGFKWGTTAAESCQMNLTMLFNPDGTGTVSGTVCNAQVNTSF